MNILFIGDIVAKPGRDAVKKLLPELKQKNEVDFVIANVENLSHGRGITEETLQEMLEAGIDFFTGGDHMFWQKGTEDLFDKFPIIRPANYPDTVVGPGYVVAEVKGKKVLIMNFMGRTSFGGPSVYLNDPFTRADEILNMYADEDIYAFIVDFHADATSEKAAFGFYLDGRVTAMLGTHTHIPTCDNRSLPKGTLFVSDVGMTGNIDSVLGVKKEIILNLYLTAQNQRFEWETTGKSALRSVLLDVDNNKIDRFDFLV